MHFSLNNTILHLSHTDVRCDSRILKELAALEDISDCMPVAFGIKSDEGAFCQKPMKARIITISLFTRILNGLYRPFRYGLNMLELSLRFSFRGIQLYPKIVHCHDTLVLPAGILIKILTGCKLIYDAHELESNKNGQSSLLAKATLAVEKLSWSRIDLLVSVSDSILDWYVSTLGQKNVTLVLNSPQTSIPSGASLQAIKSSKYFHKLYNIPDNRKVFIYLGILGPGRGIEMMLEAFSASFCDAHLVFVGYGVMQSLIESYCIRHKNIHLHSPVPHHQVVEITASADVGLCLIENASLSDYYSLPNKLFEYTFAGLKILASDFPEIKRVVESFNLGTCCSLDPHSVRLAIKSFIDSSPQSTMNDVACLSWEAQAKRLVKSYRSLLSLNS